MLAVILVGTPRTLQVGLIGTGPLAYWWVLRWVFWRALAAVGLTA